MLWAEPKALQCEACDNSLVMSTDVCTDTAVKRALFSATPYDFNLKLSTKLEKCNNIKYTFMSKDHSRLHKIRAVALILTFTLTAAFFLHSRVDLTTCRKRVL